MGSLEIAYIWGTGKTWFQVPPTLRIDLEGKLPEWSTAKDLILTLIGRLGPRAATYKVIEYHGSAVDVPPLQWSILRYGFLKEDHDGKEAYGRRDCHEASAG
jgi:aconitase A